MTRDNNRNAMPTVAALVDQLRAQGIEVKVLYAAENGRELGKKPQDREVFDIPANYRKPVGGWK